MIHYYSLFYIYCYWYLFPDVITAQIVYVVYLPRCCDLHVSRYRYHVVCWVLRCYTHLLTLLLTFMPLPYATYDVDLLRLHTYRCCCCSDLLFLGRLGVAVVCCSPRSLLLFVVICLFVSVIQVVVTLNAVLLFAVRLLLHCILVVMLLVGAVTVGARYLLCLPVCYDTPRYGDTLLRAAPRSALRAYPTPHHPTYPAHRWPFSRSSFRVPVARSGCYALRYTPLVRFTLLCCFAPRAKQRACLIWRTLPHGVHRATLPFVHYPQHVPTLCLAHAGVPTVTPLFVLVRVCSRVYALVVADAPVVVLCAAPHFCSPLVLIDGIPLPV